MRALSLRRFLQLWTFTAVVTMGSAHAFPVPRVGDMQPVDWSDAIEVGKWEVNDQTARLVRPVGSRNLLVSSRTEESPTRIRLRIASGAGADVAR